MSFFLIYHILTISILKKESERHLIECVFSFKIYSRKNEETGDVRIDKIAYHGCEKDLAPALGNSLEVGDHH